MNQSEKQAPSINACVVLTQENTQGLSFTLVGRKTEQKTSAPVCDNTLITTTLLYSTCRDKKANTHTRRVSFKVESYFLRKQLQ